ncbi:hypothetical protein SAMD00019534_026140, partial [Acytostelium subglobosum LB1]|uniref:hypothetical protein n=1 Tax=Acytostelium subglobosum LB1 TaxID=1410327 RepID=UPI000644C7CA
MTIANSIGHGHVSSPLEQHIDQVKQSVNAHMQASVERVQNIEKEQHAFLQPFEVTTYRHYICKDVEDTLIQCLRKENDQLNCHEAMNSYSKCIFDQSSRQK